MRALTQCCTPLSNAPGRKTAAQPNLEALAEICESVEVFNAGRKLLPNALINNKDKAHASRRLTMRGWKDDDEEEADA